MMGRAGLVPVGRIIRPHGVRGAVKIYAYGETLSSREREGRFNLYLAGESGDRVLSVSNLRQQQGVCVVQFSGIATRDEAQGLAGKEVFLPEDQLPPVEEGEYYYFQLIGLSVKTTSGRTLGTLSGIIETGANDVFVVEGEGREILIPALDDVICEVDLERALMVVDPPEGLIDDL